MEKFTVIVPTRDRAETLEATLRTCLRQSYGNFEIIVSDNCSDDNTKQVVEHLNDPRIKYVNPGRRLSMSGNFEFALEHVSEGFVMFIGADDGLMPEAINYVASIVRKYKVEAVSCRQATYVWPDFFDNRISGRLNFGGCAGIRSDVEIRSASEWMQQTLASPSMYCFQLPNLYCGFVHRRIIEKAYLDGRYFRSLTPDAYSAFATAVFVDNYAFSHRPFVIAGASRKSNGASALDRSGDNIEANKFYVENDIPFCDGFVNCPSFEIIGCEAFSQVAKAFPGRCDSYQIDYKLMLQQALMNANDKTRNEVRDAVAAMAVNFGVVLDDGTVTQADSKFQLFKSLTRAINVIIGPSQVVEIADSVRVGVRDVNDAALVAHVLMTMRASGSFVTARGALMRRVKELIGL